MLAFFTSAHSIPNGFDALRVVVAIIGYLLSFYILLERDPVRLVNPYLLAIFLLSVFSIMWSIDKSLTIKYIVDVLPFFGTYIAVVAITRTEKEFMRWKYYYLTLLVLTFLYTFALYLKYGTIRLPAETMAIVVDITYDLVVSLPIVIYLFVITENILYKWFYFLVVALGFLALVIAQTRGGIIAFVSGSVLAFYFLFINKTFRIKKRAKALFKILCIFLLLIAITGFSWQFVLSQQFKNKFLMRMMILSPNAEVRAEYLAHFNERIEALKDWEKVLKKHWGIGIGFGTFPAVSTNKLICHNFLIDMWISAGLIGLFLAPLFIGYTFYKFYYQAKRHILIGNKNGGYLRLTLTISFSMFIVHGMIQHLWFFNHLYIFAALSQFNVNVNKKSITKTTS